MTTTESDATESGATAFEALATTARWVDQIDTARIERAVRDILEAIGENPDRDGLQATPQRVARMYAPQVSVARASRFTTDAESDPGKLVQAIDRYGVIGHAQTSARARRNGKPLILRRDFNTTDGGQAGLHFVSLQRDIADFVRTRAAMNAASAQLRNPAITDTVNNGINEFIFVVRRGNYIVPPRARRSFPLLDA